MTKYNLLSLYYVTCIFDFRAKHLVLDKKISVLCLGEILAPTLNILQLLMLEFLQTS